VKIVGIGIAFVCHNVLRARQSGRLNNNAGRPLVSDCQPMYGTKGDSVALPSARTFGVQTVVQRAVPASGETPNEVTGSRLAAWDFHARSLYCLVPPKAVSMKYLPNALTITRILLTPVVLVLLMSNTLWGQLWALGLFVFAAISDYLDGKLARSFQVRSRLGQFLDPFADKILVLGTFTVLAIMIPQIVPWWAVVLIAVRDFAITGIRTWAESRGISLRTMQVARTKTLVQLLFLIALLSLLIVTKIPGSTGRSARWLLYSEIPFVALVLVVAFTVITGVVYVMRQEYVSPVRMNR
jgi:CDP-diacylglycerol--glycerol-3-phosphate 3-phosphatidyltransferase